MKDRNFFLASPWLRPFTHHFSHPSLWHLNRRSVPRALAIGMFVAFILPIGQFALAALLAILARANVPLSAAATLVTNPLTIAPIYLAAFKVGNFLLWRAQTAEPAEAATSFGEKLMDISGATALGLFVFAAVFAAVGYFAGALWWRVRLLRRWKQDDVSASLQWALMGRSAGSPNSLVSASTRLNRRSLSRRLLIGRDH